MQFKLRAEDIDHLKTSRWNSSDLPSLEVETQALARHQSRLRSCQHRSIMNASSGWPCEPLERRPLVLLASASLCGRYPGGIRRATAHILSCIESESGNELICVHSWVCGPTEQSFLEIEPFNKPTSPVKVEEGSTCFCTGELLKSEIQGSIGKGHEVVET